MIIPSNSYGLMPEDLPLAGCISYGIDDLRKRPFLLDYCFSWISKDPLSKKFYGAKEVEEIKKWFLSTKINVSPATVKEDVPSFPLVTIHLESASEEKSTIGDTNYEPEEEVEATELSTTPLKITEKFTPASYNKETGVVTLPSSMSTLGIFTGNLLVDSKTRIGYPILEILNDSDFTIATGVNANFNNCYIGPIDGLFNIEIESVFTRQTYSVRCYAFEPKLTMHLGMIIRFILYRYKAEYLEARGFTRSTVQFGGIYYASELFGGKGGELIFGQNFSVAAVIQEYWPKNYYPKIQGLVIHGLQFETIVKSPDSELSNLEKQGWWGEQDDI